MLKNVMDRQLILFDQFYVRTYTYFVTGNCYAIDYAVMANINYYEEWIKVVRYVTPLYAVLEINSVFIYRMQSSFISATKHKQAHIYYQNQTINAHTHARIYAHIQTHARTYARTHTHACMHARTHKHRIIMIS